VRARSLPRFLRDGIIRLGRKAITPAVLTTIGLILGVGGSVVFGKAALLLAVPACITAALLVRLRLLRRKGLQKRVPHALALIAIMLPDADAIRYLEMMASPLAEVTERGDRRRIIRDSIAHSPAAVMIAWSGWLRTRMVALAVRYCRPQVEHIESVIKHSPPPSLLTSPIRQRQLRQYWLRLRLICYVLISATGQWQYQELATSARTLAHRCRRLAQHTGNDEFMEDAVTAAALALHVHQGTRELATALDEWQPDIAP
jgi:hypothetical protein